MAGQTPAMLAQKAAVFGKTLAQKTWQVLKTAGTAVATFARFFIPKKKPPVPKEILNNTRIRRAFNRQRWARRFKRFAVGMLISGGISTATVMNPDWVSSSYDDYMKNKGSGIRLSDHFHAKAVRVYDKNAFLKPFHKAGIAVREQWEKVIAGPTVGNVALNTAATLIGYPISLFNHAFSQIAGTQPGAYAMIYDGNMPPPWREAFIQPPAERTAEDFVRLFTTLELDSARLDNKRADIEKALFEFTMLHEGRHVDQPHSLATTIDEADADLYAFKVMKARGKDTALLSEVKTLVLHARTLNTLVRGDLEHTTSFALQMEGQSPLITHQGAGAFWQLRNIVEQTDRFNLTAFEPGTPKAVRYAAIASLLSQQGLFDGNPPLRDAAAMADDAIGYFNTMSGGKLLHENLLRQPLEIGHLVREYLPVPDKTVKTPAAKKDADAKLSGNASAAAIDTIMGPITDSTYLPPKDTTLTAADTLLPIKPRVPDLKRWSEKVRPFRRRRSPPRPIRPAAGS